MGLGGRERGEAPVSGKGEGGKTGNEIAIVCKRQKEQNIGAAIWIGGLHG